MENKDIIGKIFKLDNSSGKYNEFTNEIDKHTGKSFDDSYKKRKENGEYYFKITGNNDGMIERASIFSDFYREIRSEKYSNKIGHHYRNSEKFDDTNILNFLIEVNPKDIDLIDVNDAEYLSDFDSIFDIDLIDEDLSSKKIVGKNSITSVEKSYIHNNISLRSEFKMNKRNFKKPVGMTNKTMRLLDRINSSRRKEYTEEEINNLTKEEYHFNKQCKSWHRDGQNSSYRKSISRLENEKLNPVNEKMGQFMIYAWMEEDFSNFLPDREYRIQYLDERFETNEKNSLLYIKDLVEESKDEENEYGFSEEITHREAKELFKFWAVKINREKKLEKEMELQNKTEKNDNYLGM